MATPEQIQRRLQARHIDALETLRKLRRDRAELEVAAARAQEADRRADRFAATSARLQASAQLSIWNEHLSDQAQAERLRVTATISQPIFEFDQLTSQLRRREYAEFAALRREALATENVATMMTLAKVAAASHEKIVECRK